MNRPRRRVALVGGLISLVAASCRTITDAQGRERMELDPIKTAEVMQEVLTVGGIAISFLPTHGVGQGLNKAIAGAAMRTAAGGMGNNAAPSQLFYRNTTGSGFPQFVTDPAVYWFSSPVNELPRVSRVGIKAEMEWVEPHRQSEVIRSYIKCDVDCAPKELGIKSTFYQSDGQKYVPIRDLDGKFCNEKGFVGHSNPRWMKLLQISHAPNAEALNFMPLEQLHIPLQRGQRYNLGILYELTDLTAEPDKTSKLFVPFTFQMN